MRSRSTVAPVSAFPPPLTASSRFVRLAARKKEARFTLLKREGNDLVKQGDFEGALHKYSECLALKPEECALYTNRCGAFKDGGVPQRAADSRLGVLLSSRAICFLKLDRFQEARGDCDSALQLEPSNKKAFYRRALAHKGLQVAATHQHLGFIFCRQGRLFF